MRPGASTAPATPSGPGPSTSSTAATTTTAPTVTAPTVPPSTSAAPAATEPEPDTEPEAEPETTAPPATQDAGAPPPSKPARRCASDAPVTTGTRPGPDEQGGRRWVVVGELHGACDGTGSSFHVAGVDTRLVVRSDAPDLSVYVVDDVQGEDATAGFPDASCNGPCAFEQTLVLPAADYHLRVAAGDGPWEVSVEEYRAPG